MKRPGQKTDTEAQKNFGFVTLYVSLLFHIIIIGGVYLSYRLSDSYRLFKEAQQAQREKTYSNKQTLLLLEDNKKVEEEEDMNARFASERNTRAKGRLTEEEGYNAVENDSSSFNPLNTPEQTPLSQGQQENVSRETFSESTAETDKNTLVNTDPLLLQRERTQTFSSSSLPAAMRMPTSFEDDKGLRINFNSDGTLHLGSQLRPHSEYFRALVETIRASWYKSLPQPATMMGLVREDEVVVLMSVDKNGTIGFEKILDRSKKHQIHFEASCISGVRYAGNAGAPPDELMEESAVDEKLYIPFKFTLTRMP